MIFCDKILIKQTMEQKINKTTYRPKNLLNKLLIPKENNKTNFCNETLINK